jgi:PKD repeat protein
MHSLTKGYDPVANFTFVKVPNEPFAIQFIDQSFGSTPLTYQWSFGDNNRDLLIRVQSIFILMPEPIP